MVSKGAVRAGGWAGGMIGAFEVLGAGVAVAAEEEEEGVPSGRKIRPTQSVAG